MTRKQRRLGVVVLGLAMLGVAAALVLTALEDSIVFFYSPTDLVTKQVPTDRRIRIGGLVEKSRPSAPGGTTAACSLSTS